MRTVFMGTPEFSVLPLEELAKLTQVVGVFTQPDRPVGRGQKMAPPPVKVKAQELGLKIFQPESMRLKEAVLELKSLDADLMIVSAYGQILTREVLELPKLGCINIHTSLLPRWRGAAPVQWAILSGDQETGISLIRMVEKLDAGPIVLQESISLEPQARSPQVLSDLSKLAARMMKPLLEGLRNHSLQEKIQDESSVTYAKKIDKSMQWINWQRSVEEVDRQIRALDPWPGSSIHLINGERIKIVDAQIVQVTQGKTGTLDFDPKNKRLYLHCASGSLEILRLQLEGKPVQRSLDFVNRLLGQGISFPIELSI